MVIGGFRGGGGGIDQLWRGGGGGKGTVRFQVLACLRAFGLGDRRVGYHVLWVGALEGRGSTAGWSAGVRLVPEGLGQGGKGLCCGLSWVVVGGLSRKVGGGGVSWDGVCRRRAVSVLVSQS